MVAVGLDLEETTIVLDSSDETKENVPEREDTWKPRMRLLKTSHNFIDLYWKGEEEKNSLPLSPAI